MYNCGANCAVLSMGSFLLNSGVNALYILTVTFVQVPILYVTKGTMYLWILSYLCTHVPIMGNIP